MHNYMHTSLSINSFPWIWWVRCRVYRFKWYMCIGCSAVSIYAWKTFSLFSEWIFTFKLERIQTIVESSNENDFYSTPKTFHFKTRNLPTTVAASASNFHLHPSIKCINCEIQSVLREKKVENYQQYCLVFFLKQN